MPGTVAQCTGILLFRAIGRKIARNVRRGSSSNKTSRAGSSFESSQSESCGCKRNDSEKDSEKETVEDNVKCRNLFFGDSAFSEKSFESGRKEQTSPSGSSKIQSPSGSGKRKEDEDSGYDSCQSYFSNGQVSHDGSSFGEGVSGSGRGGDDKREKSSKRWNSSHVASLTSALQNLRLQLQHRGGTHKKPKKQPKSILRRPVRHVYVRGISGLPTHRVPVSTCYYRQPRPGARFYT